MVHILHFMISFLIIIISISFSLQKLEWQQYSEENTNSKQCTTSSSNPMRVSHVLKMLQSVDFEVFGRVQGVFFRKYTQQKGKELGLKGWCMNTSRDTVVGTIQGKEEMIEEMKDWLQHTGSPMSKIEKCVFSNDRHISKEEFDNFFIKKHGKLVP